MAATNSKPVKRQIVLDETEWKWLCDWLTNLLRLLSVEDLGHDSLKMADILMELKQAKRVDDART